MANELLVIINIKSMESFAVCCKKTTTFYEKLEVIVLGELVFIR